MIRRHRRPARESCRIGRFPDIPLISSSGAPTSLAAYRGKYIVMAPFLSPVPGRVPAGHRRIHRPPTGRPRGRPRQKVVFMEITIDPGRDTPARLAAYSKEFGADWVMLTGTPANLDALWKFFGVSVQIVPEEQPPKTRLVHRHSH